MEQGNFQPSGFIKSLKLLYTAIASGCVAFMGIAVYLNNMSHGFAVTGDDKDFVLALTYISIFSLAVVPLAYYLFKKNTGKIPVSISFSEKLFLYRKNYIIKMAMIEGVFFFCNVCYLLVNVKYILFIAIMAVIVLLLNYPNKNTIGEELNLNPEELNQL
jgi:hypothetical protein